MSENIEQEYLPKRLIQCLVYLWIALINVGVDFGLLLKASQSTGVVILIFLFAVSIGFSIYWTRELVALFRKLSTVDIVQGSPEIV